MNTQQIDFDRITNEDLIEVPEMPKVEKPMDDLDKYNVTKQSNKLISAKDDILDIRLKKNLKYNQVSPTAAVLLTLLFGPLGLMYVNIMAGLLGFVLAVCLITFTGFIGLALTVIVSIIAAIHYATDYNEESFQKEKLVYLEAQEI